MPAYCCHADLHTYQSDNYNVSIISDTSTSLISKDQYLLQSEPNSSPKNKNGEKTEQYKSYITLSTYLHYEFKFVMCLLKNKTVEKKM